MDNKIFYNMNVWLDVYKHRNIDLISKVQDFWLTKIGRGAQGFLQLQTIQTFADSSEFLSGWESCQQSRNVVKEQDWLKKRRRKYLIAKM